ncbi:MAG: cytochrome C oxidase subunit II [Flavobacteriaceae bacterium CG_4_8_14_3_um_filter_34_10]|nr:cytochrome c oxidase subunit II [Flavobacteriia bacterium]OIP49735.1 MAG: cytochrome C oxidase subunit II [Flavobacteriaceae bacterium CG2_30_34_30]PIQ19279.1 MAG: cytochrome C oxidase subunit II [Flavobacteriaceae bacterium CG18_big_fil_WC_8_21_14_2_50_34_36]PIV48525.1 MAG: cytochrome C oxidase subunit II [Flavobacteriaceae bacterium CG02_land_8_20_14_3_00_34_13]PIX09829.1 MAG: cytochrome C oxidase subunit II [Flavobacteriaceae bacterium CG_4_8_14_3_um_filter_34_10]PIZ07115.1 MAG: cytochro
MTVFLVLTVLFLFAITIWQMKKIFNLSRLKPQDNSQIATENDNNNQGKLMLGFLVFFYIFLIVGFWNWTSVLLPESGSEHGKDIDQLMLISMILIFTVLIITHFLLLYFAFKYRGIKNRKAIFFADNDQLEFVWTIIPVIVLSGLIIYGLFTWTDIMNIHEDDDPIIVELYAKQFIWEARYSGQDNTLGQANVRFIEGVNTMGVDVSDAYAADDVPARELHLPVGRKVLFKMRSQDVLHSAYMPHFRAQMNVVPGMITQFALTPDITTADARQSDEIIKKVANINKLREEKSKGLVAKGFEALDPYEFDYLLLCNKICGASHYNMQMKIIVETQEEFDAWIAEQKTLSQTLNP